MRYRTAIGAVISYILASSPALAQTGAHLEFIDTGTPKNGSVVMNGWHGVIVRVVLDNGAPITRINLGGANGFGGDISGAMAQRWTDPNGQENYTQTSPGPLTANNSFDSDFNFDSHLLGTPAMYAASSSFTEAYFGSSLTKRTGLPSDGFVGYLASPFIPQGADPIVYGNGVHLGGLLDINPVFQSNAIDAAYVVTDSGFEVGVLVSGGDGGGFASGVFQLPEPSGFCVVAASAAAALFRRRTRNVRAQTSAAMEALETRVQLTVPAPTGVSATLGDTGSATIAWNNMGAGLSYSVERSTDGSTNWQAATASLLAPGTTTFTNPRIDAARAYYRVTATDGTDSATSSGVQETVSVTVAAPTFEAEAEALSAGGVRLKWELDPSVAPQVIIYRKAATDSAWPTSALEVVSISGPTGQYDDSTVAVGGAYEYRLDFSSQEKHL